MRITTIVLLPFLLGSSSSFSTPLKSRLHRHELPDSRSVKQSLLASAPPKTSDTTSPSVLDELRLTSSRAAPLELDLVQGCIRQGNIVLLNGLSPSIWSATRVKEGDDTSLFLHTRHAKEKAAFETALGDLISCNRLLSCARKYHIQHKSV